MLITKISYECTVIQLASITIPPGEYKQWTGLLEWNTGLDYWNELF